MRLAEFEVSVEWVRRLQAQELVETNKANFDAVSDLCREEIVRFEAERILDLRETLLTAVQVIVAVQAAFEACNYGWCSRLLMLRIN